MTTQFSLMNIAPLLFAYLAGSVPYGLVIARLFCGIDPRTAGSGNIGTTNVARLCGKKWGLLTLLCDLGKGALAIFVAWQTQKHVPGTSPWLPLAAGFLAILGHMYPIFLKFKGGKGVATTVGVYLTLVPLPFLISGALCLAVTWRTGFVSAGSLVMVTSLPLILFAMQAWPQAILATLTGLLIVYAHRDNIYRLRRGEEKAWNTKKTAAK